MEKGKLHIEQQLHNHKYRTNTRPYQIEFCLFKDKNKIVVVKMNQRNNLNSRHLLHLLHNPLKIQNSRLRRISKKNKQDIIHKKVQHYYYKQVKNLQKIVNGRHLFQEHPQDFLSEFKLQNDTRSYNKILNNYLELTSENIFLLIKHRNLKFKFKYDRNKCFNRHCVFKTKLLNIIFFGLYLLQNDRRVP